MEKVPDNLTCHAALVCHPPPYWENTLFFPQLPAQALTPLPRGKSPANAKASLPPVLRTPTVRSRSSQNGKCSRACVTHGSRGQDIKGVIGARSRAGARGWKRNPTQTSWDPSESQHKTIEGCPWLSPAKRVWSCNQVPGPCKNVLCNCTSHAPRYDAERNTLPLRSVSGKRALHL